MKIIKIIFCLIILLFFIHSVENVLKVFVFKTAQWWEISSGLNNLMLIGFVILILAIKILYRLLKKL